MNFIALPNLANPIMTSIPPAIMVAIVRPSTPYFWTMPYTIITNAAVGPPICTLLPPNAEIRKPAMIAVINPLSGVTPERGLITAIIAGFLISALGGSRVQIGGPTAAFVIIVYGIVQKYGVEGLTIATIMAGGILVIMGLAKFGSAIKFIPHPVIVGFTSGIAITIFLSQIKDFLGLNMGNVPSNFIDKFVAYEKHITGVNWYAAVISVACVLIIVFWKKIPAIGRKIPGSLIALILATVAVSFFNLPVETIGSKFGELTAIIHAPSIPLIDFETIRNLIGPATAIAILAGIEALLSAVVSDGMIGGKHR